MTKYSYILELAGNRREVNPLNTKGFSIGYDAPDDRRFSFAPTVRTAMTFSGADFKFIYAFETSDKRCLTGRLEVYRDCNGTKALYQVWNLRMNTAKFDLNTCIIEATPEVDSPYACWDERKQEKKNLFALVNNTVTVNFYKGTLQYVDYTSTTARDFYRAGEFPEANPEANGWTLYKYERVTNTQFNYFYVRENIGGTTFRNPILISREITGTDDGHRGGRGQTFPENYEGFTFESTVWTMQSMDNGMLLNDVLNAVTMDNCGKPFKSNFFQYNSDGSIDQVYPGFPDKTVHLVLFQKSDVKRPNDYRNATRAEITGNTLVEDLGNLFNLQFVIDQYFQLEHVSFFNRGIGLNTLLPKYKNAVQNRQYEYLQQQLPEREVFTAMEQHNPDFVGMPIEYKGACKTPGMEKIFAAGSITTDLEMVLTGGVRDADGADNGKVSDEGFVLVACEEDNGNYYVLWEAPILDNKAKPNNGLAWAQLHRDYWKWERPQKNGYMNGQLTIFNTTQAVKKGNAVTVPFCCGDILRLTDLVRTALGTGIVGSALLNLDNETLTIEPLYFDDTNVFMCFPPATFAFVERVEPTVINDEMFRFNVTFQDGLPHDVEVEIKAPDNSISIVPASAVNGVFTIPTDPFQNGTYYFRIRTVCGAEKSDWSPGVSVYVDTGACADTFDIAGVTYAYNSANRWVAFSWPEAKGYPEVEVLRPGGSQWIDTPLFTVVGGTITARVGIDKVPFLPAQAGTYQYRFRIRCTDTAAGPWSETIYININP